MAGADDGSDANNLTIDYAYDKAGRKIAETDPAAPRALSKMRKAT